MFCAKKQNHDCVTGITTTKPVGVIVGMKQLYKYNMDSATEVMELLDSGCRKARTVTEGH